MNIVTMSLLPKLLHTFSGDKKPNPECDIFDYLAKGRGKFQKLLCGVCPCAVPYPIGQGAHRRVLPINY